MKKRKNTLLLCQDYFYMKRQFIKLYQEKLIHRLSAIYKKKQEKLLRINLKIIYSILKKSAVMETSGGSGKLKIIYSRPYIYFIDSFLS